MKFKTTLLFAAATTILGLAVYFFDIKKEAFEAEASKINSKIIKFDKNQINFIEIQKNSEKYVLQKNQDGWSLLEPIQDSADNDQVENLIDQLVAENYSAIAKETSKEVKDTSNVNLNLKLSEFGLDKPYASFNFKNNLGQSEKISIGSQKNFEGQSFLRIDSDPQVLVAAPVWLSKADQPLMTYREKRLYRSALGNVFGVIVVSLQDKFELKRVDNKWLSPQHPEYELDQNKVREAVKQIAETQIQDYIVDGEPPKSMLTGKKLVSAPVTILFQTESSNWSVAINQSEKENAIFALTNQPTNLLKIESSRWEFLGNLNLDRLRDRSSILRFNLNEIKKVYYKTQDAEITFTKGQELWKAEQSGPADTEFSAVEFLHFLNRVHDLEISEFFDSDLKKQTTQPFSGRNMLILSSETGNLIYQLNWGPEKKLKKNGIEKDYFYARTNLSPTIFALETSKIQALGIDQVFKKKLPRTE